MIRSDISVAIIGAGFFGHHIAEEISEHFNSARIDIFEAQSAPLLGAGTVNSPATHGVPLIRAPQYTIYQSIMGFDRFVLKYPEFVHDVDDNIYAIHRKGLTTADQYIAVMDSFSLPYQKVPIPDGLFTHPEDIALTLRVKEKSVDVQAIRSNLTRRFNGNLHVNSRVAEIDAIKGRLRVGSRWFGPYDYIIKLRLIPI